MPQGSGVALVHCAEDEDEDEDAGDAPRSPTS
jgi:hypothetical protein